MQTKNCEQINNGDVGYITSITGTASDAVDRIDFGDDRIVEYENGELEMLDLAYACTVHKSQRETAYNNFLTVVNTFRKKFHSFAPNIQDEYHNTIAQMIETILPAWMSYRNTFVCL